MPGVNSPKANEMTECRLPNRKLRTFYDIIHKHTIPLIIHHIPTTYRICTHTHRHTRARTLAVSCLLNNVIALSYGFCTFAWLQFNYRTKENHFSDAHCRAVRLSAPALLLLQLIWRQTRNDEVIEHTHKSTAY